MRLPPSVLTDITFEASPSRMDSHVSGRIATALPPTAKSKSVFDSSALRNFSVNFCSQQRGGGHRICRECRRGWLQHYDRNRERRIGWTRFILWWRLCIAALPSVVRLKRERRRYAQAARAAIEWSRRECCGRSANRTIAAAWQYIPWRERVERERCGARASIFFVSFSVDWRGATGGFWVRDPTGSARLCAGIVRHSRGKPGTWRWTGIGFVFSLFLKRTRRSEQWRHQRSRGRRRRSAQSPESTC